MKNYKVKLMNELKRARFTFFVYSPDPRWGLMMEETWS